jgi:hypothetical protein
MTIYFIKSQNLSIEKFDFMQKWISQYFVHQNLIFKKNYSAHFDKNISNYNDMFLECNRFRTEKSISENDYVFLLIGEENNLHYVSGSDETLKNIFIKTNGWCNIFQYEINDNYPVLYEITAWLLRSNIFKNLQEIEENTHQHPKGCLMDFCEQKTDKILKMRTGDICEDCLDVINKSQIDVLLLGSIFNALDNIQKNLLCRASNKLKNKVDTININFKDSTPIIKIVNSGKYINLSPISKAIYLLVFNKRNGLFTNDLQDDKIKQYLKYLLIIFKTYRGRLDINAIESTINKLCDKDNKDRFYEEVSKINAIWKKSIAKKLSEIYGITKEKQIIDEKEFVKYKIVLPRENFEILNMPDDIKRLIQN